MLDSVYIFTLHLWYYIEYLLNLFVSEILNWLSYYDVTKMAHFYVIFNFITL